MFLLICCVFRRKEHKNRKINERIKDQKITSENKEKTLRIATET